MKPIMILALCAFALPSANAQDAGRQAELYYQKGLAAEKAGDPEIALAAYQSALKAHPGHANARYRVQQVKLEAPTIKAGATAARFGEVSIPIYELENASLQEAVELLTLRMEESTEGKIVPNFIIEDPKGRLSETLVSMRLKNIPVKAILNYLQTQTNTKLRYDEHAIVILAR